MVWMPRRERGVDLQGLPRLALRRLGGHEPPGAGVVQPVGEFHDEHPDVLGHRDDHLADRLGLRAVAVLQLVELRDTVDEHGDLIAEVVTEHVEGVVGVLDGVVQQGGGKGLRPDPEVGEDLRHGDRVGDVRLAALAQLAGVRLVGRRVCALDQRDIRLRVVRPDGLEQPIDGAHRLGPREQTGQDGAQRGGALRLRHTRTSGSLLLKSTSVTKVAWSGPLQAIRR
jgi:hypothetical protein